MISLPFARGVMELCGAGAGFSLAPFCAVSSPHRGRSRARGCLTLPGAVDLSSRCVPGAAGGSGPENLAAHRCSNLFEDPEGLITNAPRSGSPGLNGPQRARCFKGSPQSRYLFDGWAFGGVAGVATDSVGILATDCWRASSFSVSVAICLESFFVSAC